jgi:hypothetical protein
VREHIRVGDSREFLVAADLTSKGFEVYLGHGKSSFDLVAYKAGVLLRIEVKGIGDGKRSTGPVFEASRSALFDVQATVSSQDIRYNRSIYYPANPVTLELTLTDEPDTSTTKRNLTRQKQAEEAVLCS